MSKEEYSSDHKSAEEQIEDIARNNYQLDSDSEVVKDKDAQGYVNHHVVIDEAENKRLRRLVHKRVLSAMLLVYITQVRSWPWTEALLQTDPHP